MSKSPAQRARGAAQAEALLAKTASIMARSYRLWQEAGCPDTTTWEPVQLKAMPADVQAMYNAVNARYQARFRDGRDTDQAADQPADQLVRARHRARFGTETAK